MRWEIVNKRKTLCKISLVSIALILLLVSSVALAATENNTGNATIKDDYASSTTLATTEESASSKVTETQITTSGHAKIPAIYGDRIVWSDHRDTNESNWKSDIYMYDISNKKETKITTSVDVSSYDIYDKKIVWSDSVYPNTVYMYDLSTSQESVINGYNSYVYSLSIYGDKVVWDDSLDDYMGIYMYDLSTKEQTFLTYDAYSPAIYGNRIVWENRDGNIYIYDLSTKKQTRITTTRGSVYWSQPAIYGNRIVYAGTRNGNTDVYMYDLSTKKQTQITSSPDDQTHPAIYGNRIVWEDDGGDDDGGTNHGIYMYDISTKQKMKISAKGAAYNPAIYGNNIVWQYGLYENSNIYMGTISNVPQPKPPVAAFSAKPTSGKVPLKVQFTDKSSNSPTSWKWNFGDGKYSTFKDPSHTYSKAGKYTVSLTVKNAAGTNTKTIKNYVTASELKSPVATFSASPRSGKAPLKVQFTDKSSNSPTSWKWSFGDKTYSTAKNPVHTYSKAGKYTVSLTVKNAKGSNTKTISGYIVVAKK